MVIFSVMFFISGPITTKAASARKQALLEYAQILTQEKLKVSGEEERYVSTKKLLFALAYIDNNSIPELIVRAGNKTGFGQEFDTIIYTWRKGQVQRLTVDPFGEAYQTKEYYKKTGVFIQPGVYGETMYIKLMQGKTKRKMFSYKDRLEGNGKTKYYGLHGKKVNRNVFNSQLRKLLKNKKKSKFVFHKNTVKNRKKYLVKKNSNNRKKSPNDKKNNSIIWYKNVLNQRDGLYTVKCWNKDYYDKFSYIVTGLSEYHYYYLKDVNKDGVKELFLSTNASGQGYGNRVLILTYYRNKVRPLMVFDSLRGGIYIEGEKIYPFIGGSKECICRGFRVKHGRLKQTIKTELYSGKNLSRVFKKNNKRISERTYNRIINKIVKKDPISFRYIYFQP